MKKIIAKNKKDLIKKLRAELSNNDEKIYINMRPYVDIMVEVLEHAPNVKYILCPKSLYAITSIRVKKALERVGVLLVPFGEGAGRPNKYDDETVGKLKKMYELGVPVKEISKSLKIPLRTVYHIANEEDIIPDKQLLS